MAMSAVLQVRMDSDLKREAEDLYTRLGTSFAEAVRVFARQGVSEQAMPFAIKVPMEGHRRRLGIANGEFEIPDDIDADNETIAQMFGVAQ